MRICNRCVLPETFPGISFDHDGVCCFCTGERRSTEENSRIKARYREKFLQLKERLSGKSQYDVIMAYSGGKDSTYTLYLFKEVYGLEVLAFTFDNTFMSEAAFRNIQTVCDRLRIDNVVMRPDPEMLRNIFRAGAEKELFPPKTTERASTICTSCIGMVKSVVLKTAIEKSIPFVGFGWSPGQAPVKSSVMRTNPVFVKTAQDQLLQPLARIAGKAVERFFLSDRELSRKELFPWNVHPLAFEEYDEDEILAKNESLGWKRPKDTDPNSTNCILNAYANHVHRQRYGFHPYAWEIANLVRDGYLTRNEGLRKVETPENSDMVETCRRRLRAPASQ